LKQVFTFMIKNWKKKTHLQSYWWTRFK
jgi:hypothetical protein